MGGFPDAFNVRLMLWRQRGDKWVPTVISTSCSPFPPHRLRAVRLWRLPSDAQAGPRSDDGAAPENWSTSRPITSRPTTKMKWRRERIMVEGRAAELGRHLLFDRSRLIMFAVTVHFQKTGLRERPFCCCVF